MIDLVRIDAGNRHLYETFDLQFHEDLSKYQSRIYPKPVSELTYWYYIKYGDAYVGSIWLEKEAAA